MVFAYLLAASPVLAQSDTALPRVFELLCNWEHEARLDHRDSAPELPNGIAYSSSSRPAQAERETTSGAIEIAGVTGTRHFVMPDIGGPLAGMFITVYADGRSVRTQNYRIHGELAMYSTLGACEVIE
ncbi:hypothetical protein [uncultured Tateyamaria sp.]|uniref:hypothetical protein n=1 Tax=uncultured Tateyamaria sp. TaxID=455651 RepID=UPI00260FAA74|nr:hypothetical protein [uncultured Tateyamaria sp.]